MGLSDVLREGVPEPRSCPGKGYVPKIVKDRDLGLRSREKAGLGGSEGPGSCS